MNERRGNGLSAALPLLSAGRLFLLLLALPVLGRAASVIGEGAGRGPAEPERVVEKLTSAAEPGGDRKPALAREALRSYFAGGMPSSNGPPFVSNVRVDWRAVAGERTGGAWQVDFDFRGLHGERPDSLTFLFSGFTPATNAPDYVEKSFGSGLRNKPREEIPTVHQIEQPGLVIPIAGVLHLAFGMLIILIVILKGRG